MKIRMIKTGNIMLFFLKNIEEMSHRYLKTIILLNSEASVTW